MLPFLIAGAAVGGLIAHASASADNNEANRKNERANKIIEKAKQLAESSERECQQAINSLSREKKTILKGNMRRFVKNFSKIKPVNFSNQNDFFEIQTFTKNEISSIQLMINTANKVDINSAFGGASGVALALSATDIVAGGSVLGGAGISVGGLTGGMALSAVAAPIFAVTGIFSAKEASANLEKAKANLSKARAYEDKCETYSYFAKSVGERCDLFTETLHTLNSNWFTNAVDQLEYIVNSKKTFSNFLKNVSGQKIYTPQEIKTIASVASLAKMLKTIIDTNILDNNGKLTENSKEVIISAQNDIENNNLPVFSQVQTSFANEELNHQSTRATKPNCVKISKEQLRKNKSLNINKGKILPLIKFIMWAHMIFYCISGVLCFFGGLFISGILLFFAGCCMYPNSEEGIKFKDSFIGMIVFLILALFFA